MMSLFSIPKSIGKKYQPNEKELHVVWEQRKQRLQSSEVGCPYLNMRQGSLGIKKLNLHIRCLLRKWSWKF